MSFMQSHMLALIALLPLVGFLLNGTFATSLGGNRFGHGVAAAIGCATPLLSFALTITAFLQLQAGGYTPIVEPLYRWAAVGGNTFDIAFHFDRLSAVMTLIVTGVGSVIHIYSTGYMHDDKSFALLRVPESLLFFMPCWCWGGRCWCCSWMGRRGWHPIS